MAGCGINAKARETGSPNYVQVYFPDVPGIPDRFDQLKIIIEEILPCQLGIEYVFWYLNWMQLEDKFANWDAIAVSYTHLTLPTKLCGVNRDGKWAGCSASGPLFCDLG